MSLLPTQLPSRSRASCPATKIISGAADRDHLGRLTGHRPDMAPGRLNLLVFDGHSLPSSGPCVKAGGLTQQAAMSPLNLRHGIFLPPFHPMEENPTACLDRDLELIEWLDRLGYHEAWIGEHHSAGFETISSPELFIAIAGSTTSKALLVCFCSRPITGPTGRKPSAPMSFTSVT